MEITQQHLECTDLVVLVGGGGLVEGSSHRARDEVVTKLHNVADAIEQGTL